MKHANTFEFLKSQFESLWKKIERDDDANRRVHIVELSHCLLEWESEQRAKLGDSQYLTCSAYWKKIAELVTQQWLEIAQQLAQKIPLVSGELTQLQQSLEEGRNKSAELEKKLGEIQEELQLHQKELANLNRHVEQLKNKITSLREIDKLINEIEDIRAGQGSLEKQLLAGEDPTYGLNALKKLLELREQLLDYFMTYASENESIATNIRALQQAVPSDIITALEKLNQVKGLLTEVDTLLAKQVKQQLDHDEAERHARL